MHALQNVSHHILSTESITLQQRRQFNLYRKPVFGSYYLINSYIQPILYCFSKPNWSEVTIWAAQLGLSIESDILKIKSNLFKNIWTAFLFLITIIIILKFVTSFYYISTAIQILIKNLLSRTFPGQNYHFPGHIN